MNAFLCFANTKVLLLSATPVNNQIADIRNQISLIAGGDVARSTQSAYDEFFRDKLGVSSVKETTRQAQSKFTTWTKKPPSKRNARDLIHQLGSDFFKLLDGLSIARSRTQIKRYYAEEVQKLGGFPERVKPRSEYPLSTLPPLARTTCWILSSSRILSNRRFIIETNNSNDFKRKFSILKISMRKPSRSPIFPNGFQT